MNFFCAQHQNLSFICVYFGKKLEKLRFFKGCTLKSEISELYFGRSRGFLKSKATQRRSRSRGQQKVVAGVEMEGLKSLYFLVLLGNILPSTVLATKGVVWLDSLTFDKVCIIVLKMKTIYVCIQVLHLSARSSRC